jgi:hypothetical protein
VQLIWILWNFAYFIFLWIWLSTWTSYRPFYHSGFQPVYTILSLRQCHKGKSFTFSVWRNADGRIISTSRGLYPLYLPELIFFRQNGTPVIGPLFVLWKSNPVIGPDRDLITFRWAPVTVLHPVPITIKRISIRELHTRKDHSIFSELQAGILPAPSCRSSGNFGGLDISQWEAENTNIVMFCPCKLLKCQLMQPQVINEHPLTSFTPATPVRWNL